MVPAGPTHTLSPSVWRQGLAIYPKPASVMTVLPLPPEFWDCRCATAHPALQVVFKVFIQDLGLFCKAQSYGQLKEWMSDLPGTKGTAGDTTL
jgi:hypothetical protein